MEQLVMFMRNSVLLFSLVFVNAQADKISGPNLGHPVSNTLVEKWNRDIFPNGEGLPAGSGTAKTGKHVYTQHCQMCHGVEGTGDSADELAGAQHTLTDDPPDKIIGNYWPYATTIFDFTRRSMPLHKPGKLSNNDLYAVTAYLLYLNGIISEHQSMNKKSLAQVKMPNRDGFINIYSEEQKN
jgi:cytochrome c